MKCVRTNTKEVRDLTLSVSKVDSLPSKKAGIDGPGARSEHGQGGAERSQHDAAPGISRMGEGVPHRNDRDKHSGDGRP